MKKRIYRLTESDLHNIIRNIVKEVCEDDDLKKQQMDADWADLDRDDAYNREYIDFIMGEKYLDDSNINVHDYHLEKNKLPF